MHLLAVTQSYVYANTTAQAANQIIRRQQTNHPDLYVSDATTEIYLEIRTQIRQGQRISRRTRTEPPQIRLIRLDEFGQRETIRTLITIWGFRT